MAATGASLPILNLKEATFECTYGRGCEGSCCREGRPPVYPDEAERISANLQKFLPLLRPEARALIARQGYATRTNRWGYPIMRVAKGWCVFFNQGCVLHRVGAEEGNSYQYKPSDCALFPLQMDAQEQWYIRQQGYKGEKWDLFCLHPAASLAPAAESLREEIELARLLSEPSQPPQPDDPTR